MKSFREYLHEAISKSAVFTFGRFQPATIGHEKLLKAVSGARSSGGKMFVFLSQTQDKKDNPLSWTEKVDLMKKMFPEFALSISSDSKVKTIIDAMKSLEAKGFKNVKLVVGDDRVEKFKTLLNQYNGTEYTFDGIEVVSAGVRDPDGDEVEGMSASKMRAAAKTGDKAAFMKGLPKSFKEGEELFSTLEGRLKK